MKLGFTFNKDNILSSIIKKFTKGKWSHVFLIIGKIDNKEIILESTVFGGVRIDLLEKYQRGHHEIEIFECLYEEDSALETLEPYLGKPYGIFQIVGFVLAKLLKLKKNPFTDGLVCSELVGIWLKSSKHADLKEAFIEFGNNEITPKHIYDTVCKSQLLFKQVL